MQKDYYDASEVKESASTKMKVIIKDLFPSARIAGNEARVGNMEGEKGASMAISLNPIKFGQFYDHSTKDRGDLFTILEMKKGMPYQDAIEFLAEQYTSCIKRPWEPDNLVPKVKLNPADLCDPLTDEIVKYMETERKVSKDTLINYQVASAKGQPHVIAAPHFQAGKVNKIAAIDTQKKGFWALGSGGHGLFGANYVTPSLTKGTLLITEGQCFPGDVEVFTRDGWVRWDNYNGQDILNICDKPFFAEPKAIIQKEFEGQLVHHSIKGWSHMSTPDHSMVSLNSKGERYKHSAEQGPSSRAHLIPRVTHLNGEGTGLTKSQIALYLAVSADAKIDHRKNGNIYCHFSLKKTRKKERLIRILKEIKINYTSYKHGEEDTFNFTAPDWLTSKQLPNKWLITASREERVFILDEMVHWDGNVVKGRHQYEFNTTSHHNAKWMQTIAHTAGFCSSLLTKKRKDTPVIKGVKVVKCKTIYKTTILLKKHTSSWQAVKTEKTPFKGKVFCAQTTSGQMMVRHDGKISISGNCDALSMAEAGMPAVSVPSGVSNCKWITECWEYLQQFHTIKISYDMDDAGQDALEEVVRRLGVAKCLIVKLPLSDASDMLKAGRIKELQDAVRGATPPEKTNISPADKYKEEVKEHLKEDLDALGDRVFLDTLNHRIRDHELTVLYGREFAGKTVFATNQAVYDAAKQITWVVASFEQKPTFTLANMLTQFAADKDIALKEAFDAYYDAMAQHIHVYKSTDSPTPEEIIEQFTYEYKRKGVKRFILDNWTAMDMGDDSNKEHAKAINLFRNFVNEFPVHVIVVMHPRKPSSDKTGQEADRSEVRGAGQLVQLAHNVLLVHRYELKADAIFQLQKDGRLDEVVAFDRENPDGKVKVQKNRFLGTTPQAEMWFDKDTKAFMTYRGQPVSMPMVARSQEPECFAEQPVEE